MGMEFIATLLVITNVVLVFHIFWLQQETKILKEYIQDLTATHQDFKENGD
jgi:uncharacterized membrane protein